MQTHTTSRRRNRVYKSLHKPLTYLGVERTVFFFVCVGAVGAFNLFNSLLAGLAVFVGGVRIRKLGHQHRPRISPHSGQVREVQRAVRRC
jgi:hypothetical protein